MAALAEMAADRLWHPADSGLCGVAGYRHADHPQSPSEAAFGSSRCRSPDGAGLLLVSIWRYRERCGAGHARSARRGPAAFEDRQAEAVTGTPAIWRGAAGDPQADPDSAGNSPAQ